MKLIPRLLCATLLLSLISCRSKSDKEVGVVRSLSDLKDYAENVVAGTKKAQQRADERRKKGDTLAIPYKELQVYLPEVSGYTSEGGPKGSQMTTPGLGSWSQAQLEAKNGEKRLDVSILDYNAAHQAFLGLTAVYGMGMSFEDDHKKQAPVNLGIENVKAFETVYKEDTRSELVLIVGDRFVVNLKSFGEADEDFLRDIAKSMKLADLASK